MSELQYLQDSSHPPAISFSSSTTDVKGKESAKTKSTFSGSDSDVNYNNISKSLNQLQNLITESQSTNKMTMDCMRENCVESNKVVVQVLPSVDLSSISALSQCSTFSGISSKSKIGKNESSDSYKSETLPSSSSGNWSSEESFVNVVDVSDDRRISEFGQIYPSKKEQVSKLPVKRRKSSKRFVGTYSICPGNGMKLLQFKHIATGLATSSVQVIRILHYLLFGVYGLTTTEALLQKTKHNILEFSGFSFDEDSEMYERKKKALLNLPFPLLVQVHRILMNSPLVSRSIAVVSLLQFLQKPTDLYFGNEMPQEIQNGELSENEIMKLKNNALEAHPVVLLERLNGNFSEKVSTKNEEEEKTSLEHQTHPENYVKPSFVHNGTGVHLKCFPGIVYNIHKTRRRIVNLLHSLLYGRPGSDAINRQNILEFNGFKSSQKNFVARKMAFLKRLRAQELQQLCEIFSLRVKTGNKNKKIIKLLQFLASPDELNAHKKRKKQQMGLDDNIIGNGQLKKVVETDSNCRINETVPGEPSVKLRDFDSICAKVECATPDFLSELSDLLFVKPCDNSEIHQKILDFTSFSFNANSFDFHCRKTIMHYMDMKTVRKIADLLNIENWENCRSHQELSQNILNFLMNMKLPEKKKRSTSDLKNKRLKCRPNIMKIYSCRDSPKSRSCSPENFDSTYASEEMNENDCDFNLQTPVSCYKKAHSGYPRGKNGLFPKQEHDLNDSTPLFEFVQHPTNVELYRQIDEIISTAPLSITLGNLIEEVLKCYPEFNLQYRIDFIRKKALEILQEFRENTVIFPD